MGHRQHRRTYTEKLNNEPHKKDSFCPACAVAKGRRKPYNKKRKGKEKQPRAEKPFECIHSDLMQASAPSVQIINAPSKFRYSIVFVDEFTRMSWRYGLKTKDEAVQAFQMFHQNCSYAYGIQDLQAKM